MGETITITIPQAAASGLLTALIGALLGFFWDKRREARRCEECPEHKEHQERISKVELKQAALESTLQQLCARVTEIHDMMFQFLQKHGAA